MPTPEPRVQNVTSTQTTAPWSAQQPFLQFGFQEARDLYNRGPQQFFPGQTFASPDPATTAGLGATEARARAGSPLLQGAQNEAARTLAGDYLMAGNPYFNQMAERIRAQVQPGIIAKWLGTGGQGGGMGRALGLGLGDALGSLAYQNYGDERSRMAQAMATAPGLGQADYYDPSILGQVGAAREAIAQQPITEAVARHDFGQIEPANALARFMAMIQGNYGQQSTGTTQQLIPQQNPWLTALGTALGVGGTAASIWRASDARLKKDIKPVGETYTGIPIYTYRYKDEGAEMPKSMGVMAQDVAEVEPEAVGLLSYMGKPVLGVDYGKLSLPTWMIRNLDRHHGGPR